ncbi:unnamed protein product [Polarella glacialis]|uniref:Uncharacterized protein n=1 Tax=Polarella glacialis TaxID=89957 RepID=A0A813DTJ3_POLGL|nr:unnamed protein product [Polarella glacialis]
MCIDGIAILYVTLLEGVDAMFNEGLISNKEDEGGVALYLESLMVFSVTASQAQFYGREEVEFAYVGLSGVGDFFKGVLRTEALSIYNNSVGVDKYFDVAFPRWGVSFIQGFIGRTFEMPVMVIQGDIVIFIHDSLFSTAVNGGDVTFDGDFVSSNGSDEFIPSKFKRKTLECSGWLKGCWSSRGRFMVFIFPGERPLVSVLNPLVCRKPCVATSAVFGYPITFVTFYGASISSSARLGERQRVLNSVTRFEVAIFKSEMAEGEVFGRAPVQQRSIRREPRFICLKLVSCLIKWFLAFRLIVRGNVLKEFVTGLYVYLKLFMCILLAFLPFGMLLAHLIKFELQLVDVHGVPMVGEFDFVFIYFSLEFLPLIEELSDSFSFRGDPFLVTPFFSGESIPDFFGEALFFYDSGIHTRVAEVGMPTFPSRPRLLVGPFLGVHRLFVIVFGLRRRDNRGSVRVFIFLTSGFVSIEVFDLMHKHALFLCFFIDLVFDISPAFPPIVNVSQVSSFMIQLVLGVAP